MSRAELIRMFVAGITDSGAAGAGSSSGSAGAAGANANAGEGEKAGEGDSDGAADDAGDGGDSSDDKKPKQLTKEEKLANENQTLRTTRKIFTKVTGFKDTTEAEDYEHKLKKLGRKSAKEVLDEYLASSTGDASTSTGSKAELGKTSAAEELLRRQIQERDDQIRQLNEEREKTARQTVEDSAKAQLRQLAAEVGVKAGRVETAVRVLSDEFVRDVDGNLERDAEGNFLIYRMSGTKRIADVLSVDSLRLIVEGTMKEFVETRGSGGSGGSQRGEGRGASGADPSKGLYTIDEHGNVKVNVAEYNKLDTLGQRKLQEEIAKRATG